MTQLLGSMLSVRVEQKLVVIWRGWCLVFISRCPEPSLASSPSNGNQYGSEAFWLEQSGLEIQLYL